MIDDILDVLGMASDAADVSDAIDVAMNVTDLADLSDLADLADVSDVADISGITELTGDGHFVDSLNDGYNVSFGSQKATLESVGGKKLDATIDKEPGTANRFCIKTWKGTVHNVPGGTDSVKIDGIKYKLPVLKG